MGTFSGLLSRSWVASPRRAAGSRVEGGGPGTGGRAGPLGPARVVVGSTVGAVASGARARIGDGEVVRFVTRAVISVVDKRARAGAVPNEGRAGGGRTVGRR